MPIILENDHLIRDSLLDNKRTRLASTVMNRSIEVNLS